MLTKSRSLFISVFCALTAISLFSFPARAQDAGGGGGDPIKDGIDRVNKVVQMLLTIVIGFTNVVVTPLGISAAVRIFRHVVVANV